MQRLLSPSNWKTWKIFRKIFRKFFLLLLSAFRQSLTLHPTLSRGQRKVFEGESENQAARTWTRSEGAGPADVAAETPLIAKQV